MSQPYVVTVSSEKGGVGKTTLATNLAIYLKALHEDLDVTLFSFDNHFSVDRMFRIGRSEEKGDVLDMFVGKEPRELVETGEYGIQFVPSSRCLNTIRHEIQSPETLAKILSESQLGGIVVIDTRPDMDIFTQNALFASDRVIVPVKDAPSLENCKNLYDFFSGCGLSKKALRVLPCLIDTRVRYQGPFKDSYQLLKAYAINRGYRCMEGYIAKSPKVESLNTNPEGKIYPILSHGRGTDVHLQFSHLARQVYIDFQETPERRLAQVREEKGRQQQEHGEAFRLRRAEVHPACLLCGKPLVDEKEIAPAGYFIQSSDGRLAGYLEEECFSDVIFRNFYQAKREGEAEGPSPLKGLFRESAQRSYFALRRAPLEAGSPSKRLAFYRFDEDGLELSCKVIELKEFETRFLKKQLSPLYALVSKALFNSDGAFSDRFLLIRYVNSDSPEEILYHESYQEFLQIAKVVAQQFN